MSSERSQKKGIQSNEEKSSPTHWVCCIANERHMTKQVELWIGNRNSFKEKYEKITSTSSMFYGIKNEDVLHIYGHGEKNKNIIFYGEKSLNPRSFLKFLKDNKLDTNHKYLEIDACYSDEFAKKFAKLAIADFPDLRVTGYPGQFVLCQGDMGKNLANLEEPFVILDKGRWIVNDAILTEDNEAEYYAEKHRKVYYTTSEKKQEVTELKSVNATTSSAATSDPNVIPHPYLTRRASTSSYTGYESTLRESLPGRKSWSEILAQVPASPVEILENKSVTDQPVTPDMTKLPEIDIKDNTAIEEINNNTATLELTLEKSKINDIINGDEEYPSPTPRK